MMNLQTPEVERLQSGDLDKKNIQADVLRLDKIHETISGNKWFKLKYYLQDAIDNNYKKILTFGGAYSNHIVATASAAKNMELDSVGIIRGEQPIAFSHTLAEAKKIGMELSFITRNEYKRKNDGDFLNEMNNKFHDCYIIPEGGFGINGVKGSSEILQYVYANDYTHILCATGTGTMFAGLANASTNQKIIGICVLKGIKNLLNDVDQFILKNKKNCEVIYQYHFGGYAKKNNELIKFMNAFYKLTGIPTDFVYTGKLFYAVFDLIEKDYFPGESKLLVIHSGGLQGNDSLKPGILNF